ncbi:hypothetical protein H4582DRAFT_2002965, partial [Lactarius indigo]
DINVSTLMLCLFQSITGVTRACVCRHYVPCQNSYAFVNLSENNIPSRDDCRPSFSRSFSHAGCHQGRMGEHTSSRGFRFPWLSPGSAMTEYHRPSSRMM